MLRIGLLGALIVAGLAGPAPSVVSATGVCASVGYSSTTAGGDALGPYCLPYGGTTTCNDTSLGLSPTLVISEDVCAPEP